jgi:hypothetical protein
MGQEILALVESGIIEKDRVKTPEEGSATLGFI